MSDFFQLILETFGVYSDSKAKGKNRIVLTICYFLLMLLLIFLLNLFFLDN